MTKHLLILLAMMTTAELGYTRQRPPTSVKTPPIGSYKTQFGDSFYATRSREMILKFQHNVQKISVTKPTPDEVKSQADKQVTYLFGSLTNSTMKGVPRRNHRITPLEAKLINPQTNTWSLSYAYMGTIQMEGVATSLRAALPVNPDKIYAAARIIPGCLDSQHPEAQYFWYFFNANCGLKPNIDYSFILQSTLEPVANTKLSYPEYERLISTSGSGEKEVTIALVFGMDDSSKSWNPMNSNDYNAYNYQEFVRARQQQGYISQFQNGGVDGTPYTERLAKTFNGINVKINLFFGPTDSYEGQDFHVWLADALATSSMVIYNGHSGLGAYLDVKLINRTLQQAGRPMLSLPKDRYQIVFWNGCSSYPYYNQMYMDLKKSPTDPKGTKNLDSIGNGLATLFTAIEPSASAVVDAVTTWLGTGKKTSYQDIINSADSDNLIAVDGDEDNT